ncbi:hypothetical protein [Sulfurimonas sp.]
MIKILLILLLPFLLYASKILSYNVYDRTDRADVMITFDTPYNGSIKETRTKTKIIITLDNVTIESAKSKVISSKFLKKLSIIPLKNSTQLIASIPLSGVKLSASKTTDAYGLRLRFSAKTTNKTDQVNKNSQNSLSSLPTKKDDNLSKSYYIVVSILILGIFILFYIKRKVQKQPKAPKKRKESWLFESNKESTQTNKDEPTNNVEIRFQKAIDSENSVVMLDFGTQSYLVLMGKSNILLDKFTDEQPTSQTEFESILQNRHEELESFLSTSSNQSQEPLQAYKERAATLSYNDRD